MRYTADSISLVEKRVGQWKLPAGSSLPSIPRCKTSKTGHGRRAPHDKCAKRAFDFDCGIARSLCDRVGIQHDECERDLQVSLSCIMYRI